MSHLHDDQRCTALLARLNEYIDDELASDLCRELEHHVHECHDCRVVFDTLGRTVRLYHALGEAAPVELPADMEARLFARLKLTPTCDEG
jgi:predicted anti-sigma-YlaC factor YlaD